MVKWYCGFYFDVASDVDFIFLFFILKIRSFNAPSMQTATRKSCKPDSKMYFSLIRIILGTRDAFEMSAALPTLEADLSPCCPCTDGPSQCSSQCRDSVNRITCQERISQIHTYLHSADAVNPLIKPGLFITPGDLFSAL